MLLVSILNSLLIFLRQVTLEPYEGFMEVAAHAGKGMDGNSSNGQTANRIKPLIDQEVPPQLEVATLALGCFWSPEARFGVLEGIVRTRVGYAGGTSDKPTYRTIGDHLETVQLEYEPAVITFEQLLELFFSSHNPYREPWKRQYSPAIFYHSAEQQLLIAQKIAGLEAHSGKKVQTEVIPYEQFFLAEERHQKYKLQRHSQLLSEYRSLYPRFEDFNNSTAVARVNAYLGGHESLENVLLTVGTLGLSEQGQQLLLQAVGTVRGETGIAGAPSSGK